jgi:hypothetical protein
MPRLSGPTTYEGWRRHAEKVLTEDFGMPADEVKAMSDLELTRAFARASGLNIAVDRSEFDERGMFKERWAKGGVSRGRVLRYRTLKLPDGRYLTVAVKSKPGPRGGRTVTVGRPRRPKEE